MTNVIAIANQKGGCLSPCPPVEYSGSGDTTCPVLGNRHSGITETTIPVVETVYKYPL